MDSILQNPALAVFGTFSALVASEFIIRLADAGANGSNQSLPTTGASRSVMLRKTDSQTDMEIPVGWPGNNLWYSFRRGLFKRTPQEQAELRRKREAELLRRLQAAKLACAEQTPSLWELLFSCGSKRKRSPENLDGPGKRRRVVDEEEVASLLDDFDGSDTDSDTEDENDDVFGIVRASIVAANRASRPIAGNNRVRRMNAFVVVPTVTRTTPSNTTTTDTRQAASATPTPTSAVHRGPRLIAGTNRLKRRHLIGDLDGDILDHCGYWPSRCCYPRPFRFAIAAGEQMHVDEDDVDAPVASTSASSGAPSTPTRRTSSTGASRGPRTPYPRGRTGPADDTEETSTRARPSRLRSPSPSADDDEDGASALGDEALETVDDSIHSDVEDMDTLEEDA